MKGCGRPRLTANTLDQWRTLARGHFEAVSFLPLAWPFLVSQNMLGANYDSQLTIDNLLVPHYTPSLEFVVVDSEVGAERTPKVMSVAIFDKGHAEENLSGRQSSQSPETYGMMLSFPSTPGPLARLLITQCTVWSRYTAISSMYGFKDGTSLGQARM